MADYNVVESGTVDRDANGPIFRRRYEVGEGQALGVDIAEFVNEVAQTVPAGKKLLVHVTLRKAFVDAAP